MDRSAVESRTVPMYGPSAEAPTLAPVSVPGRLVAAPALLFALFQRVTLVPSGAVSVALVSFRAENWRLIVTVRFCSVVKPPPAMLTGIGMTVGVGRSTPEAT